MLTVDNLQDRRTEEIRDLSSGTPFNTKQKISPGNLQDDFSLLFGGSPLVRVPCCFSLLFVSVICCGLMNCVVFLKLLLRPHNLRKLKEKAKKGEKLGLTISKRLKHEWYVE